MLYLVNPDKTTTHLIALQYQMPTLEGAVAFGGLNGFIQDHRCATSSRPTILSSLGVPQLHFHQRPFRRLKDATIDTQHIIIIISRFIDIQLIRDQRCR